MVVFFQLITGIIFSADENDILHEIGADETIISISKGRILVKEKSTTLGRTYINVEEITFDVNDVVVSWKQS